MINFMLHSKQKSKFLLFHSKLVAGSEYTSCIHVYTCIYIYTNVASVYMILPTTMSVSAHVLVNKGRRIL